MMRWPVASADHPLALDTARHDEAVEPAGCTAGSARSQVAMDEGSKLRVLLRTCGSVIPAGRLGWSRDTAAGPPGGQEQERQSASASQLSHSLARLPDCCVDAHHALASTRPLVVTPLMRCSSFFLCPSPAKSFVIKQILILSLFFPTTTSTTSIVHSESRSDLCIRTSPLAHPPRREQLS